MSENEPITLLEDATADTLAAQLALAVRLAWDEDKFQYLLRRNSAEACNEMQLIYADLHESSVSRLDVLEELQNTLRGILKQKEAKGEYPSNPCNQATPNWRH